MIMTLNMPLVRIEHLKPGVQLGLWKMTEGVDEMLSSYPCLLSIQPEIQSFHCEGRKLERLGTYVLLFLMSGREDLRISHTGGCPSVNGYQVSISHTKGYVALILSENKGQRVGIDVEYRSDRVTKITERFIRPDEDSSTVMIQLVNWCAKEAVYKYFTEQNLQYFEMKLLPFQQEIEGIVEVMDLKVPAKVKVFYHITEAYVLTWVF
ncbi:MAG: 4'-phosphopantetheinyl transferase superfamily protein [Prevotella sp.]|nr:4'-phosphopantetheinyl transferase superfamily protein [Prevotella sp.]